MKVIEYGYNGVSLGKGELGQSYILAPTTPTVSATQLQQAIESQFSQLTTSALPEPTTDAITSTTLALLRTEMAARGFPTTRQQGSYYYVTADTLQLIANAVIPKVLSQLSTAGYDVSTNQATILVTISNYIQSIFLTWGYQVGSPPTVDPTTLAALAKQAVMSALQQAGIAISPTTGKAFVSSAQITTLITSARSILANLLNQQGIAIQ